MSLTTGWREHLKAILNRTNKRLAIVGVGHELRGDDAVGVTIVRRLQATLPKIDRLLLIEAGFAPENITGQLRRFEPDHVLLIDAMDMGQPAGQIQFIDIDHDIVHGISSTHTLSLALFTSYIRMDLGCDVHVLGVQVDRIALDTTLSAPVQASADDIVTACIAYFQSD